MANNKLVELPESLGKLKELHELHLSNNKFTTLPNSLGQLTRLHELHISNNVLTALPTSLGQLKKLPLLNASMNQLAELPDSIGQLPQLQSLDLSYNKLTDIPASIVQLGNLSSFDIKDNPLNPELAEAYKQGIKGIKIYLRAKSAAQITLTEAKLILVGEGEVDKTCLLSALRGDPFVEGLSTTHGIEIKPVKLKLLDTKIEITLNGWDFGGQRVNLPNFMPGISRQT